MARNTYIKTASGWEQVASTVLAVPQGLVPIVPTSVTNGSVTGDGQITFSAQTTIIINGIFTAAYDNYLVQFVGQSSTNGANLQARFASAGVTAATDAWAYGGNSLNTTAIAFSSGSLSATFGLIGPLSNNNTTANFTRMEITSPFLASEKIIQSQNVGHTTQYSFWSSDSTLTSRDGLTLLMATGTFTGTIRVYGYSKGSVTQPQTIQPYSMAAGTVNLSGTSARQQSAVVTFPVGRFSVAPLVTAVCAGGAGGVSLNATVGSVTTTGFTLYGYHVDASTWPGPYAFSWQATQMTSSTAGG